ncbi:hypothetical protein [Metabacillus idriensis]|uniref:hypothetical protein n=1 Tax=Metabacillus idriensis TaxID=324768 RepID=UPI001749F1BC|nr:hypothetical protein [Metabacillus idriensis]
MVILLIFGSIILSVIYIYTDRYRNYLTYSHNIFKENNKHSKQYTTRELIAMSRISLLQKKISYEISRRNFEFTLYSPIVFIAVFLLLYFYIPQLNWVQDLLRNINLFFEKNDDFNVVEILKTYPYYTVGGIDMVSNILAIFWSISLTIYFFVYRERKSISLSSNLASGNITFILGLVYILFNIVYGKAVAIPINGEGLDKFYTDHNNFVRLLVWSCLTLASIFYGMNTIRKMISSIDIRNLLSNSINNVNLVIYQIMLLNDNYKPNKGLYKYLTSSIETFYQTLYVSTDKNMMEVYNKSFSSLKRFAELFNEGVSKEMIDYFEGRREMDVPAHYLYEASRQDHINLHKSLLVHHASLIKSLHDNNRHAEIPECVAVFFILEPSDQFKELRKDFHTILHELIIYFDSKKTVLFRTGIEQLEKFCEKELAKDQTFIGGLRIYKHLLLNAVEQGEINLISSLVYSMKRLIKKENSPKVGWARRASIPPEALDNTIEKAIIYLVLQVLLKSIELSKYPITGFLIKYLITNHGQGEILKKTFKVFEDNSGTDVFLSNAKLSGTTFSHIEVEFTFNEDTIEYCMQKMAIIIYTQQKYAKANSLPGTSHSGELIDIDLVSSPRINGNFLKYLVEKIKKAEDKFGLVSLRNTEEYFNIQEDQESEVGAGASS